MPKDERERITVDFTGLQERLLRWRVEPRQKLGSIIRIFVAVGLELWEALERRGMRFPQPGRVESWLSQLLNEPSSDTIAELISKKDLQKLSETSGIAVPRLKDIVNGLEPTEDELIDLETPLEKSLEELIAIAKRDFPHRRKTNGINHS